jgi:phage shock protein B
MSPEVVVVALAGIVAITLIVCVPVVMIFWLIARRRDNRMLSGQEERLLRDTFEGLRRMEERITNLETILMDSERKQRERL